MARYPIFLLHIITGGRFDKPLKLRSKDFDEEAFFRSKIRERITRWTDVIQSMDKGKLFYSANVGHYVQWEDPGLVIASIKLALGRL